jgi:hypothetical protein
VVVPTSGDSGKNVQIAQLQSPTPSPGQASKDQINEAKSGTNEGRRDDGTEHSPLVVKVLAAPKTAEETQAEAAERKERISNDRDTRLTNSRLLIATWAFAGIAFLQLCVYIYQSRKLKLSVDSMTEQSKAMERHINEAARQAEAMEDVARNIEISTGVATESIRILRDRTAQQMRAYVSVVIGSAVFQDANNKFEAKPLLVNNGHTPAHKLTYHARAEIRDLPLPSDFNFPLPDTPKKGSVVGPHQSATMNAIVDNRVDEALVEQIKSGIKLGLVVWGIVNYEDAFGESHYTKFCQNIIWRRDGSIMGYYLPGHDDAT